MPGGTDPVQVALDALGAKPGDSTCTNPVRDWLTIDGSRVDDDGTLWLTVTGNGDGERHHAHTGAGLSGADVHGARRRDGRRAGRNGRRRAARADDRRRACPDRPRHRHTT
ncbi:MAG: hypothetical protein ACLUNO_09680 [Oscillospiraceae bacterium]